MILAIPTRDDRPPAAVADKRTEADMTVIPAFDCTRDFRRHREEYLAACERVLASGRLILGPETEAFEREFAGYVGSRFAVGVNSGTDALSLALTAYGVGAGDEVIVPALTAPATASAVRQCGATPRFVDVLPDALTIDPHQVREAVNDRTRAIVPVHLYGCPAAMDELAAVAARYGLLLIEDCAQGHGTRLDGRHVGTFGHVGCFSFYPTKNLGAFGDAGICVTDDVQVARRLRRLRFYGLDQEGIACYDGRNSRLDELQAALLRAKLTRLDDAVRRRRALADGYRRLLTDTELLLPAARTGHAYHQFAVRSPRRPALIESLVRHQIGFGIHYPRPLHRMPFFESVGAANGDLPVASRAADELLSLPMFSELELEEVRQVCTALSPRIRAPVHSVSSTMR